MRPGLSPGAIQPVACTPRLTAAIVALLVLILGVGCEAGPPVQEMSDARQAISIAREAGAAAGAPDDLRQAEVLLDSAERNLAGREYSQARRDALQAKKKALDALATVEPME